MKVKVMSRFEITCLTSKKYESFGCLVAHITIASPKCDFAKIDEQNQFVKGVLKLQFDEMSDQESALWLKAGKQNVSRMTYRQAQQVADFVQEMSQQGVELIIVNCEAGITRSAAVAAAILRATTGDDSEIFSSPKYSPNMFVYHMVLSSFDKPEMRPSAI